MKKEILMVVFGLILISSRVGGQEAKAKTSFDNVETVLCRGIEERMPVGEDSIFAPDVDRVYLWTKLTGAMDTTVVWHAWIYNGTEMARVELPVRSSSFRTWSSKAILPKWLGNWEVRVLDGDGAILKSVLFKIENVPVSEAIPAQVEPPDTSGRI